MKCMLPHRPACYKLMGVQSRGRNYSECVVFVSYRRKTENTGGKFPDEICQTVGTLSKELADVLSLWPCFPALGKLILL